MESEQETNMEVHKDEEKCVNMSDTGDRETESRDSENVKASIQSQNEHIENSQVSNSEVPPPKLDTVNDTATPNSENHQASVATSENNIQNPSEQNRLENVESSDCLVNASQQHEPDTPVNVSKQQQQQPNVVIQSNVLLKAAETPSASKQQPHSQPSNQSALSLLAEYTSDDENREDDSDTSSQKSVVEVPIAKVNQDYRSKVIEIDSDNDADSTSSSSSSSDSEGGTYYLNNIREKIQNIYDVDDEDDDDDDDGDGAASKGVGAVAAGKNGPRNQKKQPVRAKGEMLLEDLPPIEDLHISVPEEECVELGQIQSIVDKLVLVNALPNSTIVDLDTVLFLEKGQKVLGEVFDVLGQISEPLYCVRFNSKEQIEEKGIKVGEKVYTAPKTEYTKFVILGNLMKVHGSDASWENDVEPPPQFIEYSDDEEERAARCRTRNKQRRNETTRADTDNDEDSTKRSRDDDVSVRSSSPESVASSSNHRYPRPRGRGFRGSRGGMPPRDTYHQREVRPRFQRFDNGNPNSWHSNYTPNFMGQRGNPVPRWRLPPPPVYSNPVLPVLGQNHPPLLMPPQAPLGYAPHTAHAFMRPPPPHYPHPYQLAPSIQGTTVLLHPMQPLHSPPAPPGEE